MIVLYIGPEQFEDQIKKEGIDGRVFKNEGEKFGEILNNLVVLNKHEVTAIGIEYLSSLTREERSAVLHYIGSGGGCVYHIGSKDHKRMKQDYDFTDKQIQEWEGLVWEANGFMPVVKIDIYKDLK